MRSQIKKHRQEAKKQNQEPGKLSIATQKRLENKNKTSEANRQSFTQSEVRSRIFEGPANSNFFKQAKDTEDGTIEVLALDEPARDVEMEQDDKPVVAAGVEIFESKQKPSQGKTTPSKTAPLKPRKSWGKPKQEEEKVESPGVEEFGDHPER